MLTLAVSAMLANHLSPFAIAQWGAEQGEASKRAMGFTKGVAPHTSTFHRHFRRLDPTVLSDAVTDHFAADTPVGVAIDGKPRMHEPCGYCVKQAQGSRQQVAKIDRH